jgi:hypothetical protein
MRPATRTHCVHLLSPCRQNTGGSERALLPYADASAWCRMVKGLIATVAQFPERTHLYFRVREA